jgi:hypothetical protein
MNTIPEKYQHSIKAITAKAREFLLNGDQLQPFVFLGRTGHSLLPCPMQMSSNQAKDMSAMIVREIARVAGAEYAIMISEAWALDSSVVSMEEAKRFAMSGESIADHPNRTDVVMITLEAPEGFWMAQSRIKSLNDNARSFDDVDFLFLSGAEGRFVSFLPHQGTAH